MKEEEILKVILDEALHIHRTIGPGLLENVYKHCLAYRLKKRGLSVEIEKPIPVVYDEVKPDCGYRADLLVQYLIIVDAKNVEAISDLNIAPALRYLLFLLKEALILN